MRCTAPLDPTYPQGGTHDHVEIHRNPDNGKVRVANTVTCDLLWICPICAARIAEERREELRLVYEHSGKFFALVTLTLRHDLNTPLEKSVDAVAKAARRLKSGSWWQNTVREWGIIGNVSGLEVTYGYQAGWHPHQHILLVFDEQPGHVNLEALEVRIKHKWLDLLSQFGASGSWDNAVDVSHDHAKLAEYIAKHGHAPNDAWTEAEEMTRSRNKTAKRKGLTPWGLLDAYDKGDKQAGALFVEYAEATRGRNQLRWSPGLKELLNLDGLKADHAEEAIEEDQDTLWMKVEKSYWWALSAHRLRGAFVQAAIDDDRRLAIEILSEAAIRQQNRYRRRRDELNGVSDD